MQPHGSCAAMLVIASVGSSSSLSAQSNLAQCANVAWNESIGAAGAITRTVTGEFVRTHPNDRAPDVVLLKGGRVCVLPAVDTFGAHFQITSLNVNDIAAPPPPASGSAVSSLYTVDSVGLYRVDFTLADKAPFANKTLLAGGVFAGACRLVCGHLDNDGLVDCVAADSAKQQILIRYGNGTISSFDPSPTETIVDLAIGRYQGVSGTRQIALQLSNSLAIHSASGALVRQVPSYSSPGLIATEVNDRLGKDRVVWLTPYSGPNYTLVVAGASASDDDPAIVVGAIGARALRTGDMDRDGDSEALVVCDALAPVAVFDNLRSTANPTIPSYSLYSGFRLCDPLMGTVLANNTAEPLVVDIDGDTDGDVLHIAQNGTNRRIQSFRNETAGQLSRPGLQAGQSTTDHSISGGVLSVTMHATVPKIAGCDLVEVAMYRQDSSNSSVSLIPTSVQVFTNSGALFDRTFSTNESSTNFDRLYNFVIRRIPNSGAVPDLTSRPHYTWTVVGTGSSLSDFHAEPFVTDLLSFVATGPIGDTGGSGSRPNIIPATGSGGSFPP